MCVCFVAPLLCVLVHTKEMQREQVRLLCEEMISEISASGSLKRDSYERFLEGLSECTEAFQVELQHTSYQKSPVYEYAAKEKITRYYAMRNQREIFDISTNPVLPEKIAMQDAKLQEQNNASVLGGSMGIYVPLPKEEGMSEEIRYEAMVPVQEVYLGEELITVCMVEMPTGYYQFIADACSLKEEGTTVVQLTVNGRRIPAYVEATVYPRELNCPYGHTYACTKERVRYMKETGDMPECPYCKVMVTDISFSPSIVTTTVGTALQETEFLVRVVYQDGHTEIFDQKEEGLKFDYDAFYCGKQNVRTSYRGFLAEGLTVMVKGGKCKECGGECQEKGYRDYEKNPFCSSCLSKIPVFLGKINLQEEIFETCDIVQELEKQTTYEMKRGDFFSIQVNFSKRWFIAPVWVDGRIGTEGK